MSTTRALDFLSYAY